MTTRLDPEMEAMVRTAIPADIVRLREIAAAAKAHWGYPPAWLEQWRAALTITPADLSRWTVRGAAPTSAGPGQTHGLEYHLERSRVMALPWTECCRQRDSVAVYDQ